MNYLFLLLFTLLTNIGFSVNLKLELSHTFLTETLVLNEKSYITSNNEELVFSKLKYYIGNIVLIYDNGETYSDFAKYHLVDIEKSESMLLELKNVPKGLIKSIKFSIGVDSTTNSNGLMDGDLDPLKGMYWAWSSGFINFKVEGTCLNCKTEKEFTYHIGGFIPPNESFQTKTISLDKTVTKETEELKIMVNIGSLFDIIKISDLSKIMSPSKKAKDFSKELLQMFKIKK